MCDECIPKNTSENRPRFKMSKEERAKLPGKEHAGKKISDLTPEQVEERRLFRRAYERIYRKWNSENGDYLKQYQAEYHINYQKNHGEQITEYLRGYMKKNPEWTLRSETRRKLRKSLVKSDNYTIKDIFDKWGTVCYLCNEEIDPNNLRPFRDKSEGWQSAVSLDHVVPLVHGGDDTMENVRPVHAICNIKKGSKISEEYLTEEHRQAKVLFETLYGAKKPGRPLKD